jgi:hypothetical protein
MCGVARPPPPPPAAIPLPPPVDRVAVLSRASRCARRGCSRSRRRSARSIGGTRFVHPSSPQPPPPPCERILTITTPQDTAGLAIGVRAPAPRGARRTRGAIETSAVCHRRRADPRAVRRPACCGGGVRPAGAAHRRRATKGGAGEGTVAGAPCAAALVRYAAYPILRSGRCVRDQREDLVVGPFVRLGIQEAHPLAWLIGCGGLRVGRTRRDQQGPWSARHGGG